MHAGAQQLQLARIKSLSPGGGGGDFKREAVGAIVAAMTGAAFRNKVLVVLSGYVRGEEGVPRAAKLLCKCEVACP